MTTEGPGAADMPTAEDPDLRRSGLNDRAPIKLDRSRALGLQPVARPNDPLETSTIVLLEQFFGFAQRALLVDAWVRHPLKSIRLDKVHAIFRTVSPRTQLNREQKRGRLLDHTRPPSRAASTTRRMESTTSTGRSNWI